MLFEHAIALTYKEACRRYAEAVYETNPPQLYVENPFLAVAHAIRTAWPEIVASTRAAAAGDTGYAGSDVSVGMSIPDYRLMWLGGENCSVGASSSSVGADDGLMERDIVGDAPTEALCNERIRENL